MDQHIQIPISALSQYVYCPRRCALMFSEKVMVINEHVMAGSVQHETVHQDILEKRHGNIRVHSLPLFSDAYGLVGKSDLVEIVDGVPCPIEFKKGNLSKWENNYIQLCAQGVCLEEMMHIKVPHGFIFNLKTKRRVLVVFTEDLVARTIDTVYAVRKLFKSQETPKAYLKPQCDGCSLHEVCLPELSSKSGESKAAYLRKKLFTEVREDE